jgi:hypothetical protein
MLKLALGASGIAVVRGLQSEVEYLTGLPPDRARMAIKGLADAMWVRSEGPVVWLRNGLRFEPALTLENENHKKGVARHLKGLPKFAIVNDFADYYDLDRPFPEIVNGSHTPSHTPSHADGIPDQEVKKEGSKGRKEEREKELSPLPLSSKGPTRKPALAANAAVTFDDFWKRYPKRSGGNSRKDAEKAWNARIRAQVDPVEILAGLDRYVAYLVAADKIGSEFVKQASTFLGPSHHWEESFDTSGLPDGGYDLDLLIGKRP